MSTSATTVFANWRSDTIGNARIKNFAVSLFFQLADSLFDPMGNQSMIDKRVKPDIDRATIFTDTSHVCGKIRLTARCVKLSRPRSLVFDSCGLTVGEAG